VGGNQPTVAEIRFHIAGMPVAVRATSSRDIADLAAVYRLFPTTAPPALTVEVERVAGFDRERGPDYPAFSRQLGLDQSLHVERFDAEGEIETGELPLAARFRVGPSANSLEACVRIAASVALARRGCLVVSAYGIQAARQALVPTRVGGPSMLAR